MKIKKGDQVRIMSGKDKGKKGKVEKIVGGKVVLPGLNIYKKHMKKRDEKNQGGIFDIPRPLPMGNVALICPKCGKPTRIGYLIKKDEKKRICRKCKSLI